MLAILRLTVVRDASRSLTTNKWKGSVYTVHGYVVHEQYKHYTVVYSFHIITLRNSTHAN